MLSTCPSTIKIGVVTKHPVSVVIKGFYPDFTIFNPKQGLEKMLSTCPLTIKIGVVTKPPVSVVIKVFYPKTGASEGAEQSPHADEVGCELCWSQIEAEGDVTVSIKCPPNCCSKMARPLC
jgi:hypothetical protein